MTTLKLSKKPADAPVAKKAPARRADPAKRDRSKPLVKPDNQYQKIAVRFINKAKLAKNLNLALVLF